MSSLILRSEFLTKLYGDNPDFSRVQFSRIEVEDSGNQMIVAFSMTDAPNFKPDKWQHLNRIHIALRLFGDLRFQIERKEHTEMSTVRIQRKNGLVQFSLSGPIALAATAGFCAVEKISAF